MCLYPSKKKKCIKQIKKCMFELYFCEGHVFQRTYGWIRHIHTGSWTKI